MSISRNNRLGRHRHGGDEWPLSGFLSGLLGSQTGSLHRRERLLTLAKGKNESTKCKEAIAKTGPHEQTAEKSQFYLPAELLHDACSNLPQELDNAKIGRQPAHILRLPRELLQNINSYLETRESAAFCLTSRIICATIGRESLLEVNHFRPGGRYIRDGPVAIDLIERAFPSQWYCKTCSKFHPREPDVITRPRMHSREKHWPCFEQNGSIACHNQLTIQHHHALLAMNAYLWNAPENGIPLSSFDADFAYRPPHSPVKMHIQTAARIDSISVETLSPFNRTWWGRVVQSHRFMERPPHLVLHAQATISLPSTSSLLHSRRHSSLLALFPDLIKGHFSHQRSSSSRLHTGLLKTLSRALDAIPTQISTNSTETKPLLPTDIIVPSLEIITRCTQCATDYEITCSIDAPPESPSPSKRSRHASHVKIHISVYRDLGASRIPSDPHWQAHASPPPLVPLPSSLVRSVRTTIPRLYPCICIPSLRSHLRSKRILHKRDARDRRWADQQLSLHRERMWAALGHRDREAGRVKAAFWGREGVEKVVWRTRSVDARARTREGGWRWRAWWEQPEDEDSEEGQQQV